MQNTGSTTIDEDDQNEDTTEQVRYRATVGAPDKTGVQFTTTARGTSPDDARRRLFDQLQSNFNGDLTEPQTVRVSVACVDGDLTVVPEQVEMERVGNRGA